MRVSNILLSLPIIICLCIRFNLIQESRTWPPRAIRRQKPNADITVWAISASTKHFVNKRKQESMCGELWSYVIKYCIFDLLDVNVAQRRDSGDSKKHPTQCLMQKDIPSFEQQNIAPAIISTSRYTNEHKQVCETAVKQPDASAASQQSTIIKHQLKRTKRAISAE